MSSFNIVEPDVLLREKKLLTKSEIIKICNRFKSDYEKAIVEVDFSKNHKEKEILFIFLSKWFTGLKEVSLFKQLSIEKTKIYYRFTTPAFKKKYLFGKNMLVDKALTSIFYHIAQKDDGFINSFFFRGVHLWELGALLEKDFKPKITDLDIKDIVKGFEDGLSFDQYADIRKIIVFTMAANIAKKLIPYLYKNNLKYLLKQDLSNERVAF